MHAIFALRPIFDDNRYGVFQDWAEAPSVLGRSSLAADFDAELSFAAGQEIPSLAAVWKPLKVTGDIGQNNDYPTLYPHAAFSRRAVELLGPMLEPHGELLPLTHIDAGNEREFFACHVRTVEDILDTQASHVIYDEDVRRALAVEHFVLGEDAQRKLSSHIFRIPQLPAETFVSDAFYDAVQGSDLEGMEFYRAWPVGRREPVWTHRPFQGPSSQPAATVHRYVLRFTLREPLPRPAESKRIEKIYHEISQLIDGTAAPGAIHEGSQQLETPFWLSEPLATPGCIELEVVSLDSARLRQLLSDYAASQRWWPDVETESGVCENTL